MTKMRKLTMGVLACVAVLIAAQAAVAGSRDVSASTSDTTPGGSAHLFNTGTHESLRVCDRQADGHSAWAYVSYGKKYENSVGATGKAGSCKSRTVVAAEGRTIYVRVCLRDRDAERFGPDNKFCSRWKRGTA
jgi:hypothetical protein